jgi:maltooligosyltrehalose trehalohydrolase
VWAPLAGAVWLEVDGRRRPMVEVGGGWFRAAPLAPGTRYRVALDDGDAVPDPRSHFQPEGIEGPSCVVDHAAFAWTDHLWRGIHLPSSVISEIHIGTFSAEGTFDAAIDHLDDLAAVGVDTVEVMPVAEFAGQRGWGYDGVLLYAAHHVYGGPDGLKRFVDAAHARGMGVLLDVVYNHLGPLGNHLSSFGPYFSDRHRTPWGPAVNLDGPGRAEVRAFFIANALHWIERYHVDGLRLDAVHALVDDSSIHFLEELSRVVDRCAAHLGRRVALIAEDDRNTHRASTPVALGGLGLDAQWDDDVHHAIHAALTGERDGYFADYAPPGAVAKALTHVFVLDGAYSTCRSRPHGRPAVGASGHRVVAFAQNHDQVGNRAFGERLGQLAGWEAQRVAAAIVMTAPFVPLLFQGEEWAASSPFLFFADFPDPELSEAVRKGRQREFAAFAWGDEVPDPMAIETFERCRLHWDERGVEPHASLWAWYRSLIALRRSQPDLTDGDVGAVSVVADERGEGDWMVVERRSIRAAFHLSAGSVRVTGVVDKGATLLLSCAHGTALDGDAVVLGRYGVAIWSMGPVPV